VAALEPTLFNPEELPKSPGYSQVVAIPRGTLVWTAGQVAFDPQGQVVGAGDWQTQTHTALTNVTRALAAGGATWSDVVKLTFFLVDITGLPVVRRVRDEFVDHQRLPTSSLVQVAGLVHPDLLLEVEAVAWRP
jgi:enamine deaminase RidA (YjgF/YER057c/UK114 family)